MMWPRSVETCQAAIPVTRSFFESQSNPYFSISAKFLAFDPLVIHIGRSTVQETLEKNLIEQQRTLSLL